MYRIFSILVNVYFFFQNENEEQFSAKSIKQNQVAKENRKLSAVQESINQMTNISFEQIQVFLKQRNKKLFNKLFNLFQYQYFNEFQTLYKNNTLTN